MLNILTVVTRRCAISRVLYIYMNMCIVMNMNIYISPSNEELLRKEASMSGLINKLLEEHYGREGGAVRSMVTEPLKPLISMGKLLRIENWGTGEVEEKAPVHVQEELEEEEDNKAWVQEEYGWDNQNKCAVNKETGETVRAKLVNGKIVLI